MLIVWLFEENTENINNTYETYFNHSYKLYFVNMAA